MEKLAKKMDVIAARGQVLQVLNILARGYSDAPVHLGEYSKMAEFVNLLAHYELDEGGSAEVKALQSILFGLGRGEPGSFKTWTAITVERLQSMSEGKKPQEVELAEVRFYLEEFKRFLAELNKAL